MSSSTSKRRGKGRFPYKLYAMLEGADESSYSSIVSWNTDGRSFTIHDSDAFMEQVVPMYFQQTHFRSFVSGKMYSPHHIHLSISNASFLRILSLSPKDAATKYLGLQKPAPMGMDA
jgi:hypothetical protein